MGKAWIPPEIQTQEGVAMSETDDPMIEAAAALAEYEENLVFGDPEENHARLANAIRAFLSERPEPSGKGPTVNAGDFEAGMRWMCDDGSMWENVWDANRARWAWSPTIPDHGVKS